VLIGCAVFVALSCHAFVARAQATDPAVTLQKRAIARIDAVMDKARRSGDSQLPASEFAQVAAELESSNRTFKARENWSALALGLTKQGSIQRMQGEWDEAIDLYQQAYDAATRGRVAVRQGDALSWRALTEWSLGRPRTPDAIPSVAVRSSSLRVLRSLR
jgi:hypothetical protein